MASERSAEEERTASRCGSSFEGGERGGEAVLKNPDVKSGG